MKARSLASCILFSVLVILLLSTVAQATEYREVKAEEILKQIENGEEVNYTDCYIVGELNTSKMKLETIPNPSFYRLLNGGCDDILERFYYKGLNENYSIIKSNITIKNSIFENDVNFSNILFTNSVDFSDANFSNDADFWGANFSSDADFSSANFCSDANFSCANFCSDANFSCANFDSDAYFLITNFDSGADFWQVDFNSGAGFSRANFSSDANFVQANFDSDAYFFQVDFNSNAYFMDANFDSDANFWGANFSSDANFWDVDFSSDADFTNANFDSDVSFLIANFDSDACFSSVNFSSDVDFTNANFDSDADFSDANFSNDADFWGANFNSDAKFKGPETPDNIKTDGKSCEVFREYYESETRYEDADTIYYNYRKLCQDNKDLISFSKWSDIISWITCGYGLKPLRIFWPGVFIIGVFALLYWRGSGIYRSSDATEKKSNVSGWDAVYFSINTFTTLGSADWYPRDNFRKLVTLEGLCGWIFLGIFMATLANILIR
jgi:hypothetical protein